MKNHLYFLIFLSVLLIFSIIFILKYGFSISYPDFSKPRKCSDIFGNCADDTINDTIVPDCSGIKSDVGDSVSEVREIYINATAVIPSSWLNVTCEFDEITGGGGNEEKLWYYNGYGWYNISSWTDTTGSIVNKSAIFKVNATVGVHVVRCAYNFGSYKGACGTGLIYDNDDVNFTVTDYLNYNFWNLTNYTTGATLSDGLNLTRNDKINASANWNKDLSSAIIRHNGNGTFVNYSITIPQLGNWTNYTLDLSNPTEFSNTGLINISYIWANDTFGLDNQTSPSHYFYLWGNSKLGEIYLNQTTIYNNTGARIFCQILDNDTNQPIQGYNVSFYRNDSYLGNSLTNSSGWANYSTTFLVGSTFPGYLNLSCNITDSSSLFYTRISENSNNTIMELVNPNQVLIDSFRFELNTDPKENANLNQSFIIRANVSDTVQMDSVKANLTYPDNVINVNVTMGTEESKIGWHTWTWEFNTTYPLNETGNYTVGIIARNSYGTENISSYYMFLNVSDTYIFNLTSEYSTYMRGENVTIRALDVYNQSVSDVNWNVNITKINETYTESNTTDTYTYQIKSNDQEGNYTFLVINATKHGNHGNSTWNFNMSSTFDINITNIQENTTYNTPNLLMSDPKVQIYNARDELLTDNSLVVTLYCPNEYFNLSLTGNEYYNSTSECRTPSSPGSFNLTARAYDSFNNTGEKNLTLYYVTTTTTTVPPSGNGGGAAGPSGPTCTPEPENCTNNIDDDCDGATDCVDADCSNYPKCIQKIPNFNFNVTPTQIEILQGENGTVVGSMSNTGNIPLILSTSVNTEKCTGCIVDLNSSFLLPQQTKTSTFPIIIHVNTSTSPGDYLVNVKISYYALQNSQGIKVIVKENPTITNFIENIPNQITELISKINEYKILGLEVTYLDSLIAEIQKTLQDSRTAIKEDNLDLLEQYNDKITFDMNQVNVELDRLAFQKMIYENKFNIAGGISIGIISLYLIARVLVPFVRITTEITKLSFQQASLINTRKSTEKQYFMRTIDEPTFRKIVTDVHARVMNLTSTIKMKKEQRTNLLKKRLNPLSLGQYFKNKTQKKTTSQA